MEAFDQALDAIVGDDLSGFWRLLMAHPELVRGTAGTEVFVEAIVHQLYAGDTLLHVASAGFRPEMTSCLLSRGADPNLKNGRGSTPLFLAKNNTGHAGTGSGVAKAEQAETIGLLLEYGAKDA